MYLQILKWNVCEQLENVLKNNFNIFNVHVNI